MFRILIPVDGSAASSRVVEYLIAKAPGFRPDALQVDLLNVQPPVPGNVAAHVNAEQLKKYRQEEGLKVLAAACERLQQAGLKHAYHIAVGDPAQVIAQYAHEQNADQIVMGTRGLGAVSGMLMGSVATKVVHLSDVPVLLVK
jgi:nucleotide-binding universal stress UspA family protein